MGKGKTQKFKEIASFSHVVQPSIEETRKGIAQKGCWNHWFKNDNPIILELGCGKGEYTVSLAKRFPEKNFIGIDIKGARIWKGAKYALENKLLNTGFLRANIEEIIHYFAPEEVEEIWITFPDPQLKLKRAKKRLTHPVFLKQYKLILKTNGVIHLKTDSQFLHTYTLGVINGMGLTLIDSTLDIYRSDIIRKHIKIKTFYERKFLEEGKPITYCSFKF